MVIIVCVWSVNYFSLDNEIIKITTNNKKNDGCKNSKYHNKWMFEVFKIVFVVTRRGYYSFK